MEILTTRRLKFKAFGRTFETMGGGNIQSAPDWIIHDDLFHGAKGKGYLTQFAEKTVIKSEVLPPAEPVTPKDIEVTPPAPEKPKRKKQGSGE